MPQFRQAYREGQRIVALQSDESGGGNIYADVKEILCHDKYKKFNCYFYLLFYYSPLSQGLLLRGP